MTARGFPATRAWYFALIGLALPLPPTVARAADTVETFDAGAIDAESYVGATAVTSRAGTAESFGELVLGYGLAERFSLVMATGMTGSGNLPQRLGAVSGGFLSTPLDTPHVDIDLCLTATAGGQRLGTTVVMPGLELNLDFDPAMRSWGLYSRVDLPLVVRSRSSEEGANSVPHLTVQTTWGSYLAILPNHQLLAEVTLSAVTTPSDGARPVELGSAALGYNVVLNELFELITEVAVDLPQAQESAAVSLMAGVIATLPSPH